MNKYQKLFPGVPLVDSPFFDEFKDELWSGDDLRIATDLHEKGYAIIDLSQQNLEPLMQSIIDDLGPSYQWDAWKAGHIDSLRIQDAWRFNSSVREIASNQYVIDLLGRLYGRKAFPFQTLNFSVGTQQAAHCDYVHFSSVPDRFMCGVWIPFEDMTEDNGPLYYYPGSNKFPTLNNEQLGVSGFTLKGSHDSYAQFIDVWTQMAKSAGTAPEKFLAKKGQALIWASNLLHGGSKMNDLSATRWSQVTHYFFDDCAYISPCANDVYQAQIYYRSVVDIVTGEQRPNMVSGYEVDPEKVQFMKPPHLANREFPAPTGEEFIFPSDFNADTYLALNPDVKEAGLSAFTHYRHFGFSEGRQYKHPESQDPAISAQPSMPMTGSAVTNPAM